MASTFLITSAAFCGHEFIAELGLIPPAFLPVGNKRLFEFQFERTARAAASRVILSIPDNFAIDKPDKIRLEALGIEVFSVPGDLSLADSIIYTINVAGIEDGELRILHGDTLIENIDYSVADVISVGHTEEYYNWACWTEDEHGSHVADHATPDEFRQVVAGYFAFSSSRLLLQALSKGRGNFILGLEIYNRSRRLRKMENERWFDFGHIQTFYKSRAHMTTQRAFNTLDILPRVVRKCSDETAKISAEASWYRSVPSEVKPFLPQLIDEAGTDQREGHASYSIEYLPLLSLSDLFVYGRLPRVVWKAIFRACNEFLAICGKIQPSSDEHSINGANCLYLEKTVERLERFSILSGISLDKEWTLNGKNCPSLRSIALVAGGSIRPTTGKDISVVHGDFCFSNILYDFRTQAIKTIDPRGIDGRGVATIYGDQRYDIAKLYHSAVGYYDLIVAGRFDFGWDGEKCISLVFSESQDILNAQAAFLESQFNGNTYLSADSLSITILLFLAMLPLHYDNRDRQYAFMANALRLYGKLTEGGQ